MTLPKPIPWVVTTALLLVFTGITLFVSAGVRAKIGRAHV